jgi:hypothetical protein
MALGEVDGEPAVIALYRDGDEWKPQSISRVDVEHGRIAGIIDYVHCPWVLANALSLAIGDAQDVSRGALRP